MFIPRRSSAIAILLAGIFVANCISCAAAQEPRKEEHAIIAVLYEGRNSPKEEPLNRKAIEFAEHVKVPADALAVLIMAGLDVGPSVVQLSETTWKIGDKNKRIEIPDHKDLSSLLKAAAGVTPGTWEAYKADHKIERGTIDPALLLAVTGKKKLPENLPLSLPK